MLALIVIALALVGMAKLGRWFGERVRGVAGGQGWLPLPSDRTTPSR